MVRVAWLRRVALLEGGALGIGLVTRVATDARAPIVQVALATALVVAMVLSDMEWLAGPAAVVAAVIAAVAQCGPTAEQAVFGAVAGATAAGGVALVGAGRLRARGRWLASSASVGWFAAIVMVGGVLTWVVIDILGRAGVPAPVADVRVVPASLAAAAIVFAPGAILAVDGGDDGLGFGRPVQPGFFAAAVFAVLFLARDMTRNGEMLAALLAMGVVVGALGLRHTLAGATRWTAAVGFSAVVAVRVAADRQRILNGPQDSLTAISVSLFLLGLAPLALAAALGELRHRVAESGRLAGIIEATPDYVGMAADDGSPLFLNEGGRRLLRWHRDTIPTLEDICVWGDPSRQSIDTAMAAVRAEGRWVGEVAFRRPSGPDVPVSLTLVSHTDESGERTVSAIGRDLSERVKAESRLAHQANHDALTGLVNRSAAMTCLVEADAHRAPFVLLFIDLDRFKVINDSLGHGAGDVVLVTVASRLRAAVAEVAGDTAVLSRFGGDEFTVLVWPEEGTDPDEAAARVADHVCDALARPMDVLGRSLVVGGSAGVVVARPGETPSDLLRRADLAMYEAKATKRGRWVHYDDRLAVRADARLEAEVGLRHALGTGLGLRMAFQPIVGLGVAPGRLVGFEALLRWDADGHGVHVPPLDVVRLAEETGLGDDLFRWTLDSALATMATTPAIEGMPGSAWAVSVNITSAQLRNPDVGTTVLGALHRFGLPPHRLIIEVTEDALIDEDPRTLGSLRRIAAAGVRFAIDDFGTGYSSLSYLRRLPVSFVKLDKTFLDGVVDDQADRAVVDAVAVLAHALRLTVVAEGVERADQHAVLAEVGCDFVQGFHISLPMNVAEMLLLLERDGEGGPVYLPVSAQPLAPML